VTLRLSNRRSRTFLLPQHVHNTITQLLKVQMYCRAYASWPGSQLMLPSVPPQQPTAVHLFLYLCHTCCLCAGICLSRGSCRLHGCRLLACAATTASSCPCLRRRLPLMVQLLLHGCKLCRQLYSLHSAIITCNTCSTRTQQPLS
jgi:hypothetical protein